jgi:PAS domain S-box-containing protein
MKLRSILKVLALLAFISASMAGYQYYANIEEYAFQEAERQALVRLDNIRRNLILYLSENRRPVKVLAGMQELRAYLAAPSKQTLDRAHSILDHFQYTLGVDVCYLMNSQGVTIASSNRNEPDSFIGKNFSFRPYFQIAREGHPTEYLALGTTTNKRGIYCSYPVFPQDGDKPVGIAVIKGSIQYVEQKLGTEADEIVLVTDPRGVVFISSHQDWLFSLLWSLPPAEIAAIKASRQFGKGPWTWIGMTPNGDRYTKDLSGAEYLRHEMEIDNYPGWKIVHLKSLTTISKQVSDPLIRIIVPIVVAFCFLIGVVVFMLYRLASREILKRKSVQRALRQSEERYRSLYHNTPAMLHSVDMQGCMVSVSHYWTQAMGYSKEEVVGKPLTAFMTDDSQRLYHQEVFPEFRERGFCQDVPYRFVRKNGAIIDVLLSAISDRDDDGNTIRSLAVSIDVTQRKKAEEALQRAKEELSQYSKDLERLVHKRTHEIGSILRYTPAMVYMKDDKGRYKLVNSRYEELFGRTNQEVIGKTDNEVLPQGIAKQFRQNDQRVLETKEPIQVEEHLHLDTGLHTYLSIKFPIFDGKGRVNGVCGISTDITAVKKAQDQLRRLSGSIMANQEKERAYIARELHDELGQVLTALRMEAVWLRSRLEEADPKASERALTMRSLIDKTIEEVRSMAIRLRPGVLDHLGLRDALEWYIADFERRTGISCAYDQQNQIPDINDTIATAAYRITQEALTNVARHSGATRVQVSLAHLAESIKLVIEDDGCGFDTDDLDQFQGLGVAGMRERAGLVGGTLEVAAAPGRGTRITLDVSLAS